MGLVSWVAVGALAGLLARWFAPRSAPDAFVVSVPLCISGASVGGFIVGIPGGPWARSSVSEGVVHRASCPVLVVRGDAGNWLGRNPSQAVRLS